MTDREVKIGTQTTLTCSLTGLKAAVTITWYDGSTPLPGTGEYPIENLKFDVFKSMIMRDLNTSLF